VNDEKLAGDRSRESFAQHPHYLELVIEPRIDSQLMGVGRKEGRGRGRGPSPEE
jgi:hypothetical protein